MARLRAGILGNVRGKVAGVVGSQWKDKNYVREYVQPANPNTAAQQAQRTKMQECCAFAKPLVGPVFNSYTDKFQKSMSGFNFFIKQNIAIFDGSPDYAAIKLTEGKLFLAADDAPTYSAGNGSVNISYSDALGNNGADDDATFAAVYDSSSGIWYFPDAEATRTAGQILFTMPSGLTPTDLEVWIWAAKYQGSIVSMISNSLQDQMEAL